MTGFDVNRRKFLTAGTATMAVALTAGCLGDDDGNGDDGDDGIDEEAWEGVTEISLVGQTQGWEGSEPSVIEGETNPTLVLTEGETYEVTWENGDGDSHNFVIHDENDEYLEETDLMSEEGETQTLEFEATAEMTGYLCEPHMGTMFGDIEIV